VSSVVVVNISDIVVVVSASVDDSVVVAIVAVSTETFTIKLRPTLLLFRLT